MRVLSALLGATALLLAVPTGSAAPPKVRLAVSSVRVVPDTPRAGQTLTASVRVSRRDTGGTVRSGKVACLATVGRGKLAVVSSGFSAGRAVCRWRLPATARRRTLVGSIRVDALQSFVRKYFGRPIV